MTQRSAPLRRYLRKLLGEKPIIDCSNGFSNFFDSLGDFISDDRTDRACRAILVTILPLGLYASSLHNQNEWPWDTVAINLYIIHVMDYVPSIGSSVAASIFRTTWALLTLPFQSLYIYVAAVHGRMAVFLVALACIVVMEPMYYHPTSSAALVFVATGGFSLSVLSTAQGTGTDPASLVLDEWAPTGRLAILAYCLLLMVPITFLVHIMIPWRWSSRIYFKSTADALDTLAGTYDTIAELIQSGFKGAGHDRERTREQIKLETLASDQMLEKLNDLELDLARIAHAAEFALSEPILWPIGASQVPQSTCLKLHDALVELRQKTVVLCKVFLEVGRIRNRLASDVKQQQDGGYWLLDLANLCMAFAKGLHDIAYALNHYGGPVTTNVKEKTSQSAQDIQDAFAGFMLAQEALLVKVRKANMNFTSRLANYLEGHRKMDGELDKDAVHKIAETIISTMEEEIGRPGTHSEPVQVVNASMLRDHLTSTMLTATDLVLLHKTQKSAQDVVSWVARKNNDAILRWIGSQITILFSGINSVWKPYWRAMCLLVKCKINEYWPHGQIIVFLQFVVGFSTLVAVQVWFDGWRLMGGTDHRFGSWQLIAFITTLQPTVEATMRNGISCAAGICIGGLVGLLLLLAVDLLMLITSVAVEVVVEVAMMAVLAIFIGTITWVQPGPVSKYSLDEIADWKILLQQAGVAVFIVITEDMRQYVLGISGAPHLSALYVSITKTSSQIVGVIVAVLVSCLVAPQSAYRSVRGKLRMILEEVAVAYQQIGNAFYECQQTRSIPAISEGVSVARQDTLVQKFVRMFSRGSQEESLITRFQETGSEKYFLQLEGKMELLECELSAASSILAGVDHYGTSWLGYFLKFTIDPGANVALQVSEDAVCRVHEMSQILAQDYHRFALRVLPENSLPYKSGVGQFEPATFLQSEKAKVLACQYCMASRQVNRLQAQALLLLSSNLLYHTPLYLDLQSDVKGSDLECAQEKSATTLAETMHAIHDLRVKRLMYMLLWIIETNAARKLPKPGFNPPDTKQLRDSLSEMVSCMVHDNLLLANVADMQALLHVASAPNTHLTSLHTVMSIAKMRADQR